jgi:hypothetical protein
MIFFGENFYFTCIHPIASPKHRWAQGLCKQVENFEKHAKLETLPDHHNSKDSFNLWIRTGVIGRVTILNAVTNGLSAEMTFQTLHPGVYMIKT